MNTYVNFNVKKNSAYGSIRISLIHSNRWKPCVEAGFGSLPVVTAGVSEEE